MKMVAAGQNLTITNTDFQVMRNYYKYRFTSALVNREPHLLCAQSKYLGVLTNGSANPS